MLMSSALRLWRGWQALVGASGRGRQALVGVRLIARKRHSYRQAWIDDGISDDAQTAARRCRDDRDKEFLRRQTVIRARLRSRQAVVGMRL
jgi:hypothetical protein